MAEESFIQCNFCVALKTSNLLLSLLHTPDGDTRAIPEEETKQFTIQSFPIIQDNGGKYEWVMIPMVLRLPTTKLVNRNKNKSSEQNYNYSIQDRAASVAIQCSYEFWKSQQRTSVDTSISTHKKNEELYTNLQPFFQAYDSRQGDPSSSSSMPLDLACIWIQFCCSIGLYSQVISFIFEILYRILRCHDHGTSAATINFLDGDGTGYDSDGCDVLLYDQCYQLVHLLFMKILPRLNNIQHVEFILDHFFSVIIDRDNSSENSESILSNVTIPEIVCTHPSPQLATLEAIRYRIGSYLSSDQRSDDAIGSEKDSFACSISPGPPNFFFDAIDECFIDINKICASAMNCSKEKKVDQYDPHKTPSVAQPPRELLQNEDEYSLDNDDRLALEDESLKEYLVDRLWTSEERWLNRGKVIAGSFLMYAAWRRRKKLRHTGRSIQQAFLAPIREIIDAVGVSSY